MTVKQRNEFPIFVKISALEKLLKPNEIVVGLIMIGNHSLITGKCCTLFDTLCVWSLILNSFTRMPMMSRAFAHGGREIPPVKVLDAELALHPAVAHIRYFI